MEFEVKRIADMNRAAYNPRVDLQPEDEEYQAIERSLKRHGLVQPIVWNRRTNTVVSGHQRLTILEAQGETEVTVSVVDLDDIQEKELNVALNKITGEWDDDKLSVILNELGEEATDTGFTLPEIDVLRDELKSYFDDVTAPDEEEPTEEPEESFLLSLTFDAADEKPLKAYIKEHSEDAVVRIIVDTVTASA
ncbi:ParB N-terminal domain-containing protein [Faecalibacterium prausnitzii]|uniref:ParB N-terminal domain-containing protein n=1 Tax=Faecalibacterium prausnitzii TaxID=853 RepID=UPI001CC12397|nr:ParB N-terminal domain-containing protein [Faecalibacterium prausnitzii]